MAFLRSISLIAAALAVVFGLAGCGGGDDSAGLEPADAAAIEAKLAQVEERAAEGRCTGDNSALSSLTSLSSFVAGDGPLDYVAEEIRSDLAELLTRLGEQIQSQCEQVSDLTTTTDTTDTTDTDTTTESETTTEKTSTTTRETDQTTRETTTTQRPPSNAGGGSQGNGNQGGGNQGGGQPPPDNPDIPDNSGGIGPGMIGPIFRSSAATESSVPPGVDDSAQVDRGASR